MEEAARLKDWLSRLDAQRSERPRHIVERVRTDYLTRLDRLTEELGGYRSSVEDSLAEAKETLETRSEELRACRDRLEELRLRYEIGEIEESEWEAQRHDLEGDVVTAEEAYAEVEQQVDQLTDLLGEMTGQVESAREDSADDGEEQAAVSPGPERGATEDEEDPARESPDDSPAGDPLDDILGALPVQEKEDQDGEDPLPAADDETDRRDAGEPVRTEGRAPTADEEAEASVDSAFSGWEDEDGPEPDDSGDDLVDAALDDQGPDEDEDDDGLGFLKDLDRAIASSLERPGEAREDKPGGEDTQRLPCKECGAVNDPRAWYCEVCGMELS